SSEQSSAMLYQTALRLVMSSLSCFYPLLRSRLLVCCTPRANASKVLQVHGAGQRFREKLRVQGCRFALASDAVFPGMPLEQGQRQLPQQGEVGRTVVILDAAGVLSETNIQLPV